MGRSWATSISKFVLLSSQASRFQAPKLIQAPRLLGPQASRQQRGPRPPTKVRQLHMRPLIDNVKKDTQIESAFDTILYAFCIKLCSILLNFGSILLPCWRHFDFILAPFASPEGSQGQGHEMCTKHIDFGLPWASHLGRIFAQKAIKKSIKCLLSFFNGFFIDFENQNGSQNHPKNIPKINQ